MSRPRVRYRDTYGGGVGLVELLVCGSRLLGLAHPDDERRFHGVDVVVSPSNRRDANCGEASSAQ